MYISLLFRYSIPEAKLLPGEIWVLFATCDTEKKEVVMYFINLPLYNQTTDKFTLEHTLYPKMTPMFLQWSDFHTSFCH